MYLTVPVQKSGSKYEVVTQESLDESLIRGSTFAKQVLNKKQSFVNEDMLKEAGINELNENLVFDRKLREKAQIRHSGTALEKYNF